MKNTTIARGYRLKASTHKLIKKVQEELNLNQDKVILRAVKMYYKSIKSSSDIQREIQKEN
jgi:polyribonucleotide nucleotidyltransferase